jgi:putative exporter of polyketide antibiotics
VPFTAANWPAAIVMTAAAIALSSVGAVGYRRRDLRT